MCVYLIMYVSENPIKYVLVSFVLLSRLLETCDSVFRIIYVYECLYLRVEQIMCTETVITAKTEKLIITV